MYPLTPIKLAHIGFRIEGLSKGRAYQAASGNTSLKSCYNIGSRIEKQDPRILQLIREGLNKKKQVIEQKRAEAYQKHFEGVNRISGLNQEEKAIQEQAEKLQTAPRDNSQWKLPDDGLPTPEQCGSTVRGNMRTSAPKPKRKVPRDAFGDLPLNHRFKM